MKSDYYIGRALVDVITATDDWDWAIRLEGGALISNKDKRRTAAPEGLEGTALIGVDYDADHTILKFGIATAGGVTEAGDVTLTTPLYTISDPHYTQRQEVYPGAPVDPAGDLPPDPSPDRVVDGPERAQEATEAPAGTE